MHHDNTTPSTIFLSFLLLLLFPAHRTTSAFLPTPFFHLNHKHNLLTPHSSTTTTDTTTPQSPTSTSTLTHLEHVNLNIPNHEHALPFFIDLLGLGLDPRRAHNIEKGSGTLWANCDSSQFHLPYGEIAQTIPGSIGIVYQSLLPLKERLESGLYQQHYRNYEFGVDNNSRREYVKIEDSYGNIFYARESTTQPDDDDAMINPQPLVTELHIGEFDTIAHKYGRSESECRGIEYVEFNVPIGTASQIATFYDSVFEATTDVLTDRNGDAIAMIAIGTINENGTPTQSLLFRETSNPIPPYDGHHVALYVGTSQADFEIVFENLKSIDAIWVNPRFSDNVTDLEGARRWKQFRFKDILDLETGERVWELEHEIRSVEHDAWPGRKMDS